MTRALVGEIKTFIDSYNLEGADKVFLENTFEDNLNIDVKYFKNNKFLDEMNEKNAYKLLLENSIKYISVGHRPNLIEYHQLSLTLFEDGTHKIEKI